MFGISDQTLAIWMLENRTHGYRLRDQLRRSAKQYIALFAIEGAAIAMLACLESICAFPIPLTAIAIAFVCGAVVRDFAWFGVLRRQWPFIERITDWNKVQTIADGEPSA